MPSRRLSATASIPCSDSFFEQNSISWSGNYRGISFAFGNGLGASPAFGSPNTASGLGVNFGIAGKNGQINFALNFAQGDKRADVTQAPEVTVMNGQTGYFSDTSQTPFVVVLSPWWVNSQLRRRCNRLV